MDNRDSMSTTRGRQMAAAPDCLFCKIVAGDIPAEVVHVTERAVAFRDIDAQAPTHVLVVPRDHYRNAAELAHGDPEVTAELLRVAAAVAEAEGHEDYRLVFNTGEGVGQSVFHAHVHLLAGRPMTWPPG
jgi:histidine triad (HIT) family protein